MLDDIFRELEDMCNMTSCDDCIIRDACKKYIFPNRLSDFCEDAALRIEDFETRMRKEGV